MIRTSLRGVATTRPYWALALLLVAASACASPYRRVAMGSAQAAIGAGAIDSGVAVRASGDRYQIDFHITSSEATELELSIRCPGGVHEATLGESMASYRARRLGELQYQRERQEQERAREVAAAGGAISTVAKVQAPGVAVQAELQVDASARGTASPVPVQLGPYHRGAQSLHQTIVLPGGGAGHCRMRLLPIAGGPPLQGVRGYMEVTHIVDRARERTQVRVAANRAALDLRATIRADLVARGADPALRGKVQLAQEERERLAYEANQVLVQEANRQQRAALAVEQERKRRWRLQAKADARARDQARPPVPAANARVVVREAVTVEVALRNDVAVHDDGAVAAALALESKQRQAALQLRQRLIGLSIAGGADVYYRARLRQEAFDEEQRAARAHQVRLQAQEDAGLEAASRRRLQLIADLGTRETLVAWLIARGADPEYRRKQNEADLMSFEERTRAARHQRQREAEFETELPSALQADLSVDFHTGASVAMDATSIPAKPAAPSQVRPPRPDAQSSWIAGFYEYRAPAWVWVPGTWSTPPAQDAVWVPSVAVQLGGQLITRPGSWRTLGGKRIVLGPASATASVRDHRD